MMRMMRTMRLSSYHLITIGSFFLLSSFYFLEYARKDIYVLTKLPSFSPSTHSPRFTNYLILLPFFFFFFLHHLLHLFPSPKKLGMYNFTPIFFFLFCDTHINFCCKEKDFNVNYGTNKMFQDQEYGDKQTYFGFHEKNLPSMKLKLRRNFMKRVMLEFKKILHANATVVPPRILNRMVLYTYFINKDTNFLDKICTNEMN